MKLQSISINLAELNYSRNQNWEAETDDIYGMPAVFAFDGDVYRGLEISEWADNQEERIQSDLRILSGLYGVLKPLDLMQPYRLEMGTKFASQRGKDLYQFWGDIITAELNRVESSVLVNLASNEYFKSVHKKDISARIVTPVFMDKKDDKYKIISFYAKKARGLMSRYIIQNRITEIEQINQFDSDGYVYNAALSELDAPVFLRG